MGLPEITNVSIAEDIDLDVSDEVVISWDSRMVKVVKDDGGKIRAYTGWNGNWHDEFDVIEDEDSPARGALRIIAQYYAFQQSVHPRKFKDDFPNIIKLLTE